LNGTGFAAGKRHENVRALFPMYETAFITAALASQSITSMTALNGVRVGCGPLNVRLKITFGRLSKSLGPQRQLSAVRLRKQVRQLLNGENDAFWQGGSVPYLRLSLSQMPPSALCSASHRLRSGPE
jgi:uncharacterized protein